MKQRATKELGDFGLLDRIGRLVWRWAEHTYIALAAAGSALALVAWVVCSWSCLKNAQCRVTGRSLGSALLLLIAFATTTILLARRLRSADTTDRHVGD